MVRRLLDARLPADPRRAASGDQRGQSVELGEPARPARAQAVRSDEHVRAARAALGPARQGVLALLPPAVADLPNRPAVGGAAADRCSGCGAGSAASAGAQVAFLIPPASWACTTAGMIVFLNFSDHEVRERDYFFQSGYHALRAVDRARRRLADRAGCATRSRPARCRRCATAARGGADGAASRSCWSRTCGSRTTAAATTSPTTTPTTCSRRWRRTRSCSPTATTTRSRSGTCSRSRASARTCASST